MHISKYGTTFAIGALMSFGGFLIATLHLMFARLPEEGLVITMAIIAAAGTVVAISALALFMNSMMQMTTASRVAELEREQSEAVSL